MKINEILPQNYHSLIIRNTTFRVKSQTRNQCGQIGNRRNDQEIPQNDQFTDQAKM